LSIVRRRTLTIVGLTGAGEDSEAGIVVWRFRWLRVVVALGLMGALVGVAPDEVSAAAGRARCRPTAFVANIGSGTISTIGVTSRTKHPNDITVGSFPFAVAIAPDGRTAFVTNNASGTVSTIDVRTRTKHRADIAVGAGPYAMAITPDGGTAFVTNSVSGVVSTIDVKARTKHPTDIPVGLSPLEVALTPCRR
jgi:YVTN family beta-propeller protein